MKTLKKAMIIDDDEINNFICIKNMKDISFAENASYHLRAKEGLEYLKETLESSEELPDVIFLDINMPVMNGWDFLKEYKSLLPQFNKPIALFMLSSSIYRKDIDMAGDHDEVTDYIIKPLSKDKLKDIQSRYFS
ncbi:MAG: response regulator [Bacteroidota bacterium]